MIRFTIRILVYALILAITITLSPGIKINPLIPGVVRISSTYLLFGILFGLINAFIRPLVLLFTAKVVLRTMGLFAIVINILLLWFLSWIAGDVFVVSEPKLVWLVIGGVILTVVLMVMESFFGLDIPNHLHHNSLYRGYSGRYDTASCCPAFRTANALPKRQPNGRPDPSGKGTLHDPGVRSHVR
jgi:putative membrane protein